MLSKTEFITTSLDLNLFFLRIMKEHSFFLEMAFTPVDSRMAAETRNFRIAFERLLGEATHLADGNVSRRALESNQFATKYTVEAEKLTNFYTGVPFNTNLTKRELLLSPSSKCTSVNDYAVDSLNRKSYKLTAALANFKERLLNNVLCCKQFTLNYPLLIEHILREARLFMTLLNDLSEITDYMKPVSLVDLEIFWNRQMAEHAKFIAGLLDPTEETLIDTARMFGKEFDVLTEEARESLCKAHESDTTKDSIEAMKRLRDFKIAGTEGLLDCNIRSIIIPLLADHVLREANHYLCVLGVCDLC